MPDVTHTIEHVVLVTLRGRENVIVIRMDSETAARVMVENAAVMWLRKSPQDRAGAWFISANGKTVLVSETGVTETQIVRPIAAIDPREIVAVQYVRQKVDAWQEEE